jgi:hypothetical protein
MRTGCGKTALLCGMRVVGWLGKAAEVGVAMHGADWQTAGMLSSVSCAARVPGDHPLRAIGAIVDEALAVMSAQFLG